MTMSKDNEMTNNKSNHKDTEVKKHMGNMDDDQLEKKPLDKEKAAEPAKKRAMVYRPQNSKTGMKDSKPNRTQTGQGSRPIKTQSEQTENRRPQTTGSTHTNAGTAAAPQGQNGQNRYQGSRPQNASGERRPQGSGYQGNAERSDRPNNRYQGNRPQGQGGYQGNRSQGQGQGGYQGNRSQGQGGYQGNRSQSQNGERSDRPNNRYQGNRPQGQGQGGYQGRSQGGYQGNRPQGQGGYQGSRPQGQGSYQGNGERSDRPNNRYQGNRPQGQGGYQGRSQGGQGGYQGSNGGRPGAGNRYQGNNAGRPGVGGNRAPLQKTTTESKPLEKESRSRNSRFSDKDKREKNDRNERKERVDKLEKFGGRTNYKNNSNRNGKNNKAAVPVPPQPKEEVIKTLILPDTMTLQELADKMKVKAAEIVKKLFMQGKMVTANQDIDYDTAEEIAMEYDCICEKEVKVDVLEELLKEDEDDESTLVPRYPVVCVMGHVDHGKTSLLDAIRNTKVTDKEAGGITQHIGAYIVSINGQKITFLDTPGHEAFTAMRMRGANATDIAILVVAADDGVMPQTIEAISHAKAAGTEIIVAINKMDKPGANIDRVKQELSEHELVPEDWGGSTICVPVSAHTHEGLDQLLEMILLTAEVAELKANPNRRARGLVIEAELDKGKGPVATVLVQKGTLHVGDPIAAGSCYGKIRAMMDDKGRRVKEAGPSTPVEILGFSDVPNAGEIFVAPETEKEARTFAETFISEGRVKLLEETKAKMSLDDLFSQIQAGNLKELNLIVKADVQGSVEAVKQSLQKLSNEEVVVKIIHSGVGAINESDVSLAAASGAIIIGFNVRPDVMAKTTAEREGVDLRLYRVIYDAINDVEAAMKGMLDPVFEEKILGHAEVRQIFKASVVGTIAGSYILDGIFQRNCKVRITREGTQIFEGNLASLKRFKDDVKEVKAGYECGLVFEKFNDVKELDQVEAYTMVEVPR